MKKRNKIRLIDHEKRAVRAAIRVFLTMKKTGLGYGSLDKFYFSGFRDGIQTMVQALVDGRWFQKRDRAMQRISEMMEPGWKPSKAQARRWRVRARREVTKKIKAGHPPVI